MPAIGLMDTAYLYIDNTGKFSENNVIIQFESDNIYFDGLESYYDIYQDQNEVTIHKETSYNLELVNATGKSGFETLRIKVNPNGSLYPGLTEKIRLSDIFNRHIYWFYFGEFENGKATVPVKVTIAAEKYRAKTFTINLNITKEEYIENEEY